MLPFEISPDSSLASYLPKPTPTTLLRALGLIYLFVIFHFRAEFNTITTVIVTVECSCAGYLPRHCTALPYEILA